MKKAIGRIVGIAVWSAVFGAVVAGGSTGVGYAIGAHASFARLFIGFASAAATILAMANIFEFIVWASRVNDRPR